jgi:glutamine amidotransferase
MGNLFSVKHACEHVGLCASITSSRREIFDADAVILPGVGAFGDAMDTLRRLDLISVLKETATSKKPLVGICLGMQLLMTESYEFGHHFGLGIIPGTVVRFDNPMESNRKLKVPQVNWNQMFRTENIDDAWHGSLLEGLPNGVFIYFVHSYYVRPEEREVEIAFTQYGNVKFCSALSYRNIFGCQGHPERSGSYGLQIYRNLALLLKNQSKEVI